MNSEFRQALKAKAHHLKPVVLLGSKGLTPAVIKEAEISIMTHELMKVKIVGDSKEEKLNLAQTLCSEIRAELVQLIGNIAIIYKKKEEK